MFIIEAGKERARIDSIEVEGVDGRVKTLTLCVDKVKE